MGGPPAGDGEGAGTVGTGGLVAGGGGSLGACGTGGLVAGGGGSLGACGTGGLVAGGGGGGFCGTGGGGFTPPGEGGVDGDLGVPSGGLVVTGINNSRFLRVVRAEPAWKLRPRRSVGSQCRALRCSHGNDREGEQAVVPLHGMRVDGGEVGRPLRGVSGMGNGRGGGRCGRRARDAGDERPYSGNPDPPGVA